MLRVRVTALNFCRLEATGDPPKRKGGAVPRRKVRYRKGDSISVSESFFEIHKGSLQVLGRDLGKDAGQGKTADETVNELETLRAKARELGIEPDKRWRVGRLTAEIEARLAELGEEDPEDGDLDDENPDDGDSPAEE
jgi:hypothetical protein